jgi:protein ImuB
MLPDIGGGRGHDDLAPFVDRIGNRLGFDRIGRAVPVDSHLPERAVATVPALAPAPGRPAIRPAGPARPIRLLRRPEPIEATAPVPDDPPILFRWRRQVHRVRRAEGPERIAFEWWRQDIPDGRDATDLIRDYYRVEDEAGRRFWLYRAGLYRADQPARWYLHGFFG